MKKPIPPLSMLAVLCLLTAPTTSAQNTSNEEYNTTLQANKPKPNKSINLAINGFNYTNLAIEFFTVASQGGGNIAVSSPTSGGGGTTCCITWHPNTKLPIPIEVKWMRYIDERERWCKKTVMLSGPAPKIATALEVHFMPDGNIELNISEGLLHPKLKLERFSPSARKKTENVIYDETTADCSDVE